MSSLTGLHTELVGFFSYSRQDDLDSDGTLSALRERIQRELRGQLGRSPMNFRLWQDKEAIAPGTLWESQIETGVGQSVFFIPIVTPTAVGSPQCRHEFNSFLAREAALERDDLIFPILYIGVPELEDEQQWRNHPVLRVIGLRQYVDWRSLRHLDVNATEVRIEIARFCEQIVRALRKPWLPPEERKRRDEETARQRAADEQRRAEDARRAEETARRRAEDEQRARAAEEQRRAQDARQAEEAARRRAEVARQREQLEAQRRADDARAQRELEARRRQQALEQLAAERQHSSRQTSAAAPAPHDRDAVDAEAPRSPSRRVIEA